MCMPQAELVLGQKVARKSQHEDLNKRTMSPLPATEHPPSIPEPGSRVLLIAVSLWVGGRYERV